MGLFMGFIREEATLQRMLLKNYLVVLSGLNFYAKYTVNPLSPSAPYLFFHLSDARRFYLDQREKTDPRYLYDILK